MTKQQSALQKRREQAREEIIEDILTIARRMMQDKGVAALSFNAIAREMGIKPPSLYTYFDSKNAIYDALFRRGFIQFQQAIQSDENLSFKDRITQIIRLYMTFAYENPDLFQIMFQRPIPDFVPSDASMQVSLQSLASAQAEMQQIFDMQGINPPMPIPQALDLMIAMMHGLASLQMANHPDLPVGEGRFGQIIDHAVMLFVGAWQTD